MIDDSKCIMARNRLIRNQLKVHPVYRNFDGGYIAVSVCAPCSEQSAYHDGSI